MADSGSSAPTSASSPSAPSAPSAPASPSPPPSPSSAPPPPSSAPPPPSSSDPSPSSSQPPSSSAPPSSSSAPPPSSSSSTTSPSTTTPPPPTSTAPTSNSLSLQRSTGSDGSVVIVTQTVPFTPSASLPSSSPGVHTASKGFLQNKGAVAAVFTIVGLVAAGIIFALVTNAIRRRRAKRFDREIAEEAKRAPPPVFVDDDDDYNHGYGPGGYGADSYGQHGGDPYAVADGGYPHNGAGGPPSDALSSAVHSSSGGQGTGTPSNYMYPSGYSDLGFSEASSHGTYAQPPMSMEGGYQQAGFAGYGAPGAYEMTGYPQQQQHQWDAMAGGAAVGAAAAHTAHGAGGYTYPGEDAAATGYPPPPPAATAAHSSGSDLLTRNKSGARSLVDSYTNVSSAGSGTAVSGAAAGGKDMYADGYVSHYQARPVVEEDPYGGYESHHGHVGVVDDDASDYGDDHEGDGRRVLKVANE
ncbi:hypothetical protein FB45DRAFT_947753 [Roridomyces roridus]|uniref:Uncharacterized protein n=1 Tax=Roridomyces roridus TaxID=1738132 RepID=A0AAD7B1X8_9AGAR|nr:hypothetical protein FB45DRAFT_947753 [Roridomyces roridus]